MVVSPVSGRSGGTDVNHGEGGVHETLAELQTSVAAMKGVFDGAVSNVAGTMQQTTALMETMNVMMEHHLLASLCVDVEVVASGMDPVSPSSVAVHVTISNKMPVCVCGVRTSVGWIYAGDGSDPVACDAQTTPVPSEGGIGEGTSVNVWLRPIKAVNVAGGRVTVSVPSPGSGKILSKEMAFTVPTWCNYTCLHSSESDWGPGEDALHIRGVVTAQNLRKMLRVSDLDAVPTHGFLEFRSPSDGSAVCTVGLSGAAAGEPAAVVVEGYQTDETVARLVHSLGSS